MTTPSTATEIEPAVRVAGDGNGKPASWDPFEIWLTRIKWPRDRIADLRLAEASDEPSRPAGS